MHTPQKSEAAVSTVPHDKNALSSNSMLVRLNGDSNLVTSEKAVGNSCISLAS